MMDRERREKERQEFFTQTLRSYRTAMENAFALQEQTLELTRGLIEGSAETLRTQAESNRAAFERLAEQSRRQQEALQDLIRESTNAYVNLLQAPFSYYQEIVQAMTASWISPGSQKDAGLPLDGYDSMSVREVSERLDELSAGQIRQLRDYEARNKNRQTLLTRFDAKTKAEPS